MANILIAGNACVVTSALTLENLQKLKKYAPQSLALKDEKEKPIFLVDVGPNGSVSANGIVFNAASHDGSKLATLTMEIPSTVTDVKAWVMETIGTSINKLNALEEKLGAALSAVEADEAKVLESIKVLGAEATEE
jgi:hypothetical protein